VVKVFVMWIGLSLSALAVASELKDPTKPYGAAVSVSVAKPSKNVAYDVSSIMIKKSGASAIINHKRVAVGHRVAGAKVLRINKNKVLLKVGDQNKWVSVAPNSGLKKRRLRN